MAACEGPKKGKTLQEKIHNANVKIQLIKYLKILCSKCQKNLNYRGSLLLTHAATKF